MRNVIAAAAFSVILAACGGPTLQETATSVPKRDLTLTTAAAPTVQVVSGIELGTMRTTHRSRPRLSAAPVRVAPEPEIPAPQPVPASEPVALPEPAPVPVAAAEEPQPDPSGRELAPGATVTMIPVSAGPSSGGAGGGDEWSDAPAQHGHGGVVTVGWAGGHCGSGGGQGPVSILR
jgi:hypothetical protein